MRKIAFVLLALLMSVAANAQFEKGKTYIGASLSGIDSFYNGAQDFHIGAGAKVGYFFWDNIALTAQTNYEYYRGHFDFFNLSAGGRCYIIQNGLYMGAGLNLLVFEGTDIAPSVQVGYAFFLNRTVTIEPEIYYNQSLTDHSNYSTFGFRVGFGIYL